MVKISRWNETSIDGVLLNDSRFDENLRKGTRLIVELADVYDYIYDKADGTSAGNETGEVIEEK